MGLKTMRFLALLFTALALAPALAHLLELPNKIGLSREDYLTVQQIYRGWALLGFVVVGALLSNLIVTIMVRTKPKAFILSLIAFLGIVGRKPATGQGCLHTGCNFASSGNTRMLPAPC